MNVVQFAFVTMIVAAFSNNLSVSIPLTCLVLSLHGDASRYYTLIEADYESVVSRRTVQSFITLCLLVSVALQIVFLLTG